MSSILRRLLISIFMRYGPSILYWSLAFHIIRTECYISPVCVRGVCRSQRRLIPPTLVGLQSSERSKMATLSTMRASSTMKTMEERQLVEGPAIKKSRTNANKTETANKTKKNAVQTKLSFNETTEKKTPWAILPKIDHTENKQDAFEEVRKACERSGLHIGAHISSVGGAEFAVINAFNMCGQAFAMFLKNQKRWENPPLSERSIKMFPEMLKKYNYDARFVMPHGSYLINIANPDEEKRKKSYNNFLDDLKRCETLGIKLYNFHPGSTVGMCTKSQGIKNIAACINEAIKETKDVKIVLENAAGQKNVIGSTFEDLKNIIALVDKKNRIGVCLDTCHLFAAGYDIRTTASFEEVMQKFKKIVGLKYLVAVHLNDCKSDLGSGLDRHENIGIGKLTKETFQFIANSGYFKNMPIILETPDMDGSETIYKQEVKLMYSLSEENKA